MCNKMYQLNWAKQLYSVIVWNIDSQTAIDKNMMGPKVKQVDTYAVSILLTQSLPSLLDLLLKSYLFNLVHSHTLFSSFQYSSENKICQWPDSNFGSLVSGATALPNEQHSLPPPPNFFLDIFVPKQKLQLLSRRTEESVKKRRHQKNQGPIQ